MIYAEGIDLDCNPDKQICLDCDDDLTIFPLKEFSKEIDSLDIEADKSEIFETDTYHFTGDVVLKSNTHILSADDLKVSTSSESTLATGNVKFQDHSFLISSDILSVEKDIDGILAHAENASYQDITIDNSGAKGSGSSIRKSKHNVFINDATYSLCPVNNDDWVIKSRSLDLNLKKNRGYARNAKIEYFGIPILYLPRYSFVLKGRGSGFLTPSYQTYNNSSLSKGSYHLKIPYYFNLAPDRDLLLAATYIKYRGFLYEGKYRQLFGQIFKNDELQDSILELDMRYLSNDSSSYLTNSSASKIDRWLLDSSIEFDFNDKTHLSSKIHRVSDERYYKEINHSDSTELLSHIKVSYSNDESLIGAHILREHSQILSGCSTTCRANYLRAFEFSTTKSFAWEKQKQTISLALVSTKFSNKTESKVSGTRTYGDIGFKRIHLAAREDEIYEEIPILSSRASINSTYYNLDNGKSITRNLGGIGLDISYPFKNKGTLFGENTSHLLLPKVSYNYRGRKAQGHIPNFDTTDNYDDIMTFSKLTSNERYIGLDRISNANDITYSIESGFRNNNIKKTDPDFLNMKIAQTYRADDTVVSDVDNIDYEVRRHYSNIAASIGLALGDFKFNNSVSIEPDDYKIVGRTNSASFVVNPRKFISLGYSNDLNTGKRSINFYGSYPITRSIHIFGGRDKVTSTNTTNTETSGIAYESCCWAIRVAHIKTAAANDYDYSTSAELILKGLGSTSPSLDEKIETNIPGYNSKLN
ncbi:LPS assembly protein LptD [Candidatus Pseudothioglobus singularis]|nr:LPS assembly protein LptD [Candidatus Pseudothioglobus singularis]